MSKLIAVFNQKGGVGKTTTNINLSACLARMNKKILVIDIDPQGNTTSGLGIEKNDVEFSIYDILVDREDVRKAIISTSVENLDLIPANMNLAGAEIELTKSERREAALRESIEAVRDEYDYIFIDCPPSLGLLTINSLVAADSVLIPMQCEYYALEGVSALIDTIRLVKKNINPNIEVEGVVLNMFDGRTNLSMQVVDEVKKYFKSKVYSTLIPRNVRLAEAPSFGIPIIDYDKNSKGAQAYMDLAEEFIDCVEDVI